MNRVSIEQLARAESKAKLQPSDSFLLAYREFVAYFASLNTITEHNLIIGAHFVYGWMPRMLVLKNPQERLPIAVGILNQVKQGKPATIQDLLCLRELIDNSLVATSKLLHFINPNTYAIWDSRVYKFINGRKNEYQTREPDNYLAYLVNCRDIVQDREFQTLHESMNRKIGYSVTPYRAIELIMYMNGG